MKPPIKTNLSPKIKWLKRMPKAGASETLACPGIPVAGSARVCGAEGLRWSRESVVLTGGQVMRRALVRDHTPRTAPGAGTHGLGSAQGDPGAALGGCQGDSLSSAPSVRSKQGGLAVVMESQQCK